MRRSEVEFIRGSILRKELLDDIYRFPRIVTETYYNGYSDGILYGMEWKNCIQNTKHHVITPGALKYHGNIYFLEKELDVEDVLQEEIEKTGNRKYRLCFVEQDAYKQIETQTIYELKLRAVQSKEYENIKEKSFYYSRVIWNTGKECLDMYYDGEVYGLYSAEDGYKYKLPCYLVKDKLQKFIEKKENKHLLDYILLKDIYEKKGMSISFACMYLNECKISISESEKDCPEKLIEKMEQAVKKLKFEAVANTTNDISTEESDERIGTGGLLL